MGICCVCNTHIFREKEIHLHPAIEKHVETHNQIVVDYEYSFITKNDFKIYQKMRKTDYFQNQIDNAPNFFFETNIKHYEFYLYSPKGNNEIKITNRNQASWIGPYYDLESVSDMIQSLRKRKVPCGLCSPYEHRRDFSGNSITNIKHFLKHIHRYKRDRKTVTNNKFSTR